MKQEKQQPKKQEARPPDATAEYFIEKERKAKRAIAYARGCGMREYYRGRLER